MLRLYNKMINFKVYFERASKWRRGIEGEKIPVRFRTVSLEPNAVSINSAIMT